jgi:trimeric autotransporter adhesin
MKPLPAIAAGMLAAFLLLSPMVAAAAPTVSVSPSSGVVSGTMLTISGTTTASTAVGLQINNPNGLAVFSDNVLSSATGAFTDTFTAGGTSAWITGTYIVSATVNSQTGTASFSYTGSASSPGFNESQAFATLQKDLKGNFTQIMAALQKMNSTINSDHTSLGNLQTSMTNLAAQVTTIGTNIGTLTTSVGTLTTSLGTLTSDVTTLQSSVGTLSTSITGIQNSLTSITNSLTSISTAANNAASAANTAATQAQNAANAVSSNQTYVLVVAVLAAIVLVLELAILVRKVS